MEKRRSHSTFQHPQLEAAFYFSPKSWTLIPNFRIGQSEISMLLSPPFYSEQIPSRSKKENLCQGASLNSKTLKRKEASRRKRLPKRDA
jgi:hypothetical protein